MYSTLWLDPNRCHMGHLLFTHVWAHVNGYPHWSTQPHLPSSHPPYSSICGEIDIYNNNSCANLSGFFKELLFWVILLSMCVHVCVCMWCGVSACVHISAHPRMCVWLLKPNHTWATYSCDQNEYMGASTSWVKCVSCSVTAVVFMCSVCVHARTEPSLMIHQLKMQYWCNSLCAVFFVVFRVFPLTLCHSQSTWPIKGVGVGDAK